MKRSCFVCFALALILLAGCGEKTPPVSSSVPEGPAPDIPLPEVSAPDSSGPSPGPEAIPLALPEGDVPEGTAVAYTWDHPITVDGGRALTLRLACEALFSGGWWYGVRAIYVLEGDVLVQTLTVLETEIQSYTQGEIDPSYAQERTHCWDADGDLTIEDLNFDGVPDLRLLESTGIVNSVYLCLLWDTEEQQFRYAFTLIGYDVTVDPEQEQIVTTARDTVPEGNRYTTNYYRYDEDGALQLVDSTVEIASMG